MSKEDQTKEQSNLRLSLEALSLGGRVFIVGDFWLERVSPSLLLLCSIETGEKMEPKEKHFNEYIKKYFEGNF